MLKQFTSRVGAVVARRGFASAAAAAGKPQPTIVYTITDEAPALATVSFYPIIAKFANAANVAVRTSDISVAARIVSSFPEKLTPEQQKVDDLGQLGELVLTEGANVIKLPNVSASVPQLNEAIAELQGKGYDIPSFPASPSTDAEKDIAARYAKVLGSAVNPVLREGNSDRRAAKPVKAFAQAHPHKLKPWMADSKSHVAHMSQGDFYSSEQSTVMMEADDVKIEHIAEDGTVTMLKASTPLQKGEVIDAAVMDTAELREFFRKEFADAKASGLLLSLHLKATMMKVSDPIMFGHAVSVFFEPALTKHAAVLAEAGANVNQGVGQVLDCVAKLPAAKRAEVEADFQACYQNGPDLAMVDSSKGITNLHVPSDVIIDASMPNVVRDGGKMWNKDDALQDTKAIVPDRCYASLYSTVIEDCKRNGAFDVATMGHVPNVGLMAQKAEEYGSHDKTFEIASKGVVRVTRKSDDSTVFEHAVDQGDIWRMCQTKEAPIRDWVKLAVTRARASGAAAIFWLDAARPHDANLIDYVHQYLEEHDTTGLDISIAKPADAALRSVTRSREGKDTISCTGNVLRDYLTDLFPILELGTSAKMLSLVPLLGGGGLFETGAGGSAPKHVQQLVAENHLRWDSLGEFLALAVSFEDIAVKDSNPQAQLLADGLNEAVGLLLNNQKSPSRKVGEQDNRTSHFYIALYWAEAMAKQTKDASLAASFTDLAKSLRDNEEKICNDFITVQGKPVDIGGYYMPDAAKTEKVMRPSATFNSMLGF